VHPRLFVTPERLDQLRDAVEVPGSLHALAFAAMLERIAGGWTAYDQDPNDGNWNYARSWLAREAAFASLVTEDPTYCALAYDALEQVHADPDPDGRVPEDGYGLARAMVGLGFAMAYDMCQPTWSDAQRSAIEQRVDEALDAWPSYSHANLDTDHHGSNWVAVCRGAELTMILAMEQEQARAERVELLRQTLLTHAQTAYGPSGFTQEGVGYAAYASQFLLPVAFAECSVGQTALHEQLTQHAFHRWAMFAGSMTPDRQFVQTGVSGPRVGDEGWASLLLGTVDGEALAHYLYHYDRHMGVLAEPSPSRFDGERAGTMWALLYYPEHASAIDPRAGADGRMLLDEERGMFAWRSAWEGPSDVLVTVMADTEHHSNAWDQAEAFGLGLIAHGNRFIGSADKETEPFAFSGLLVDGQAFDDSTDVGALLRVEPPYDHVVIDGGTKYAQLGVGSATRHVAVRLDAPAQGSAVLSTLDRLVDDDPHDYAWQINVGDVQDADGISIEPVAGDRPGFLLRGSADAYLRGWVVAPADAQVVADDPLQVTTSGTEVDLWVVLVTGTGEPPAATFAGQGLETVVSLGDTTITWEPGDERLLVE